MIGLKLIEVGRLAEEIVRHQLPSELIHAGSLEVLKDDASRIGERAAAANVNVNVAQRRNQTTEPVRDSRTTTVPSTSV